MIQLNLEELIGKNISDVPDIEIVSGNTSLKEKMYFIKSPTIDFVGRKLGPIFLSTNSEDKVISIKSSLREVFNRDFYHSVVGIHGEPDSMLGPGREISREEGVLEDGFIEYKEVKTVMEPCKFDDGPSIIIWEKPSYQIQILMHPEYNKARLLITKK